MEKDRISEFLGSINSEKWNCVYQANGMTLLTTKEYDYNYEERVSLKTQLKKEKEINKKAVEYIKTTTTKNDELNCTKLLVDTQVEQLLQILEDKGGIK